MKKILVGSIMLAGLMIEGSAFAANWSGFYVGANAGAGINDSSYKLSPTGCFANGTCGGVVSNNPLRTDTGNLSTVDFIGGGQIGLNYQFYPMFVAGLQADIDYSDMNENDSVNRGLAPPLSGRFIHNVKENLNWFGTVRGRLGMEVCPNWLIYGTGGYAYGHVSSSSNALFTLGGDAYAGSANKTRSGWTAGAGVEYAFCNVWSAGLEYLYVDLGSFGYNNTRNALAPLTASYHTNLTARDNIVRFSLNYKFADL